MFSTWKYGRGQRQVENLKTSHDYETARSNQHQACNRCREKKEPGVVFYCKQSFPPLIAHCFCLNMTEKYLLQSFFMLCSMTRRDFYDVSQTMIHPLKCSGDKNGCERCTAHGLTCEYRRETSRSKNNRKSEPHSSCSSRSGREGSGSPKSAHKPHSSNAQDRRGTPQSSSSRGDSPATGGSMYDGGSVHSRNGMTTFDDYQIMSSTMEAQTSGYPATAPIGDFGAVGDYTQGTWMLDGSTSAASIDSSFVATSEAMYTEDAQALSNYSNNAGFDMYQHMDPNEDPRFWPQNQNQH